MKLALLLIVGAALSVGPALADDHLFQATQSGGLTFDANTDTISNKAGHVIPDKAPGQGSPFSGEHQCTPATDTSAAQEHANVKAKGAGSVAECIKEE